MQFNMNIQHFYCSNTDNICILITFFLYMNCFIPNANHKNHSPVVSSKYTKRYITQLLSIDCGCKDNQ